MKDKAQESWEEEFDKTFRQYYDDQGLYLGTPTVNGKRWKFVDSPQIDLPMKIKSFITSLLQKEREKVRKMVKGMKVLPHERDWDKANIDEGYNNAIFGILSNLQDK